MQVDSEIFSHNPLDEQQRQIRLVTVDRRKKDSKAIQLYLKVYNTNTIVKPSYLAVSYTWGLENDLSEIYINDKKFLVRKNLFALLAELKAHSTILRQWFWIDQICIDQSNIKERNDVVGRMSDIYQSAKEVIVWLGESSSDLEHAFDVLAGKTQIESYSNLEFEKLNRSTTAFCNRDYWNRLWIVQEMLLALRKGRDYQLPWILIDKACSGAQDRDWKSLLLRFGSQKCANPLDHVYGLLGLIQPYLRVTVDYSMCQAQLVIAVLLKCIEEWFMTHKQLNPGNVMRENFDTAIKLMDAVYGEAYQLGTLIVLQAVVWSACLFQYGSRVNQPEDKWLSFWSFLDEARTPSHRTLAESIRDNLVTYEIAARNWISWNHLNKSQQATIQHAEYNGHFTRAVKETIALASRECKYKPVDGYFVQKDDVNYAELLEAATKDGTASGQLTNDLPIHFAQTLKTPRSDNSMKDVFAIRFLDDPYRTSLPQWFIHSDLSSRGL